MTEKATPLAVCRLVREYAADFSDSMSAALLFNTEHEVGRGLAYRTLGQQALECAVSHLLLAESTDDVRHPPLDEGEHAEAEAGAEGAGVGTPLGGLPADPMAPARLPRHGSSASYHPSLGGHRSSACATLSFRRLTLTLTLTLALALALAQP